MEQTGSGKIEGRITLAIVTFSDTGESCHLKTRSGSACHFFEPFIVGKDVIQLRLDWSDLDPNGQPMLDADFIDRETGKHRSLKGKRRDAHHTSSVDGGGRCYRWQFDGYSRDFSVAVEWCASVSETGHLSDYCSAEVIPAAASKPKHG